MRKKIARTSRLLLSLAFFCACLTLVTTVVSQSRTAEAAVGTNETINYQARLLTGTGAVVPDGTYNVQFKIYCGGDGTLSTLTTDCTSSTQEKLLWTETRESTNKVTVKNGFFSVYLGSVTAFGSSVDWNEDKLWLTVNIGTTGAPVYDGEMSPFTRFSSTPYALNSKLLGGLASTSFLQLALGTQTDASTTNASISVNKTGATGNIIDLQRTASSVFKIANDGSTIFKNKTDSGAGFQIQSTTNSNLFVADTSTNRIGIGTNAPLTNLHVYDSSSTNGTIIYIQNGANTASGGIVQAVFGSAQAGTSFGLSNSNLSVLQLNGTSGAVIGNNVNGPLYLGTNSLVQATISGIGATTFKNSSNSTSAFQIQNTAATTDTLFRADTTNNRLYVGNQTATASTDSTLLVVDTVPTGVALPTGVNGGIIYDANTGVNKFKVYENGAWKTLCNTTDLGCGAGGGGSSDLDGAYLADTDKTLTVNNTAGLSFDLTTTGDFIVKDGGIPVFTINDNGTALFHSSADSANALVVEDSGSHMGLAFDTTNSHLKIYEDTVTPTNYLDLYYDNATSSAVIAASSGTTKVGNGTGPITISPGAGAAVTITGHAASTWSTDAGALTLTSAAAATWSTTTGGLTLQSGSGTVSLGTSTGLTAGGALTLSTASAGLVVQSGSGSVSLGTSTGLTASGALTVSTASAGLVLQSGSGTVSLGSSSGLTANAGLNISTAANGALNLAPNGTGDITLALDDDSTLIGTGTVTATGQLADFNLTLGNNAAVDTVAALSVDVTSAATGDADILYGINIGNLTSADATVKETGLRIGTGWDTALESNGSVLIGAQADSTQHTFSSTCACSDNPAAGTFGAQTARDGVASSIVFKGKLFVATKETDGAAVYRYDGGTTWTLVTNAVGKAVTADTANIDAYVMTIFNGKLYIGSQTGATTGAVYSSATADTTADSFTLLNATRGTFNQVGAPGVSDMIVWNSALYIATLNANLSEIVRWDGGTTFSQITATDGKSVAETTADKDGFIMAVYNGMLISGSITGSTTATVAAYQGNGTTWTHLTGTTGGGALGAETAYIDITSMSVYNGALYVAASKANAAAVYVYKGTAPVANVPANFLRVTTTVGKMVAADAANIDSIILRTYNGRLYAGSQTAAAEDTAALYEYPGVPGDWTLIHSTRGTFGAQTGINAISSLQVYNGELFVGTDEGATGVGAVYSWSKTIENSFVLKFDSGSSNYGGISFTGSRQAFDNNGQYGTFNFTNAISLSSGAFDYAEDYPTLDTSLEPGEPVSVDPAHPEHVKRAERGESVLGVVSKNPGFRLSSDVAPASGAEWVPIALVGRVPVKVTTHNGATPINPGDSLALSETPGILEKAGTSSGAIVGVALEGYSGTTVGQISLYVSPQIKAQPLNYTADQPQPGLEINGKSATLMPSDSGDATAFTVKNQDAKETIIFDNQGNASFAGTITADKIKANQIIGLEILTNKISNLEGQFSDLSASGQTATDHTASDNRSEAGDDTEVSMGSTRFETATVTLNLNVDGTITTNGLTVGGPAEFKAETTFQKLALFVEKVIFKNDVSFENHATFNKDAGGVAIIKKGYTKVEISFQKPYQQTPIVAANYALDDSKLPDGTIDSIEAKQSRLTDSAYSYTVGRTGTGGFTIILNKPATEDIQFNWLATSVKDATISVSKP
jgi:hypothetical protein